MPGFQKGNPGRPEGSKNIRALLAAHKILVLDGRHPIRELIALADHPKATLTFKRDIWLAIQAYIEAPQTEPAKIAPDSPEDSVESARATMEKLAQLSQPLEPGASA